MQIAITGGSGVLAGALREFLPDARYLTRAECDVRRPLDSTNGYDALDAADVILHAAALTDHQHPDAGAIMETNIFGTENVARFARLSGKRLVYLSTHYVYPGIRGDYAESDATWPIGAYAWAKLAGERWVEQLAHEPLIVRGSWYTMRKVAFWARQGALRDAYHSREPVASAAAKIAKLIRSGAVGTFNIGGEKRSFEDVAIECFGDTLVHGLTRRQLAETKYVSPYAFPPDCSVSTAKYDALGLA